jgi:hypothetical protein
MCTSTSGGWACKFRWLSHPAPGTRRDSPGLPGVPIVTETFETPVLRTAMDFAHALRYDDALLSITPLRNPKTCASVPVATALALAISQGKSDPNDRMVLRPEFERIQHMSGSLFDLDACCNPSGDNKLCPEFCSAENSFLRADVQGKHVWLHPPFDQLEQFIAHYCLQKQLSPCDTSACILVPAWFGKSAARWRKCLSGMRLLHTYPVGYHLFSSPNTGAFGRSRMPGIPWEVQVWYDPPQTALCVNALEPAGGLTMSFEGLADRQPCSVLVDTGAKGEAFVSAAFAARMGLRVNEAAAVRYRVANDVASRTHGTAPLALRMQGHMFELSCHVIDMLQGYDVILGDSWLLRNRAFIY